MSIEDKKGAFDRLVAGLNSDERYAMLQRINSSELQSVQLVETEVQTPEKNISLYLRYKSESPFYKFILKIRSFFEKISPQKIYNYDIIAGLARKVTRDHPGLLNHKFNVLDSIFYERLKSLKDAADFFKPYFSFIDQNAGDFYVFLSSFVTPELCEKINSTADPFTLPFSTEPTSENRKDLLRKLDEILNHIDGDSKAKLYAAVSCVNWLRKFSTLPFIHFTSQFTNVTGTAYTCPYKNAITDFNAFSSVFSDIREIDNEVLEAIFLYSQRKELNSKNAQESDIERAVRDFMSQANAKLAAIQMFISGVPVIKVGKIINLDFDWNPPNMEGVEAWFPSFRNHWRSIIEIRWNDWIIERKKSLITESLNKDFGLAEFPVIPYRPWSKLWMRVPFSNELTGGFLSWFASEKYDDFIPCLNDVMLEGVFTSAPARNEYSEGLNDFVQANNQVLELLSLLSPAGEYGSLFEDFATNKIRSLQVQNQIDSMMATVESGLREALNKFVKGVRLVCHILQPCFEEPKDHSKDSISNFNTIKGHANREWREKLASVHLQLVKCQYYLSELEPIDTQTRNV